MGVMGSVNIWWMMLMTAGHLVGWGWISTFTASTDWLRHGDRGKSSPMKKTFCGCMPKLIWEGGHTVNGFSLAIPAGDNTEGWVSDAAWKLPDSAGYVRDLTRDVVVFLAH